MSARIWKFQLVDVPGSLYALQMPAGAHVLTVQLQCGTPTLWALVDPSAPMQERTFCVIGTGWEIHDPAGLRYIGTFQDDPYVWHVLEVLA